MTLIDGRHDVFVSMPTGSGKSLVYQLPAVAATGKVSVVVWSTRCNTIIYSCLCASLTEAVQEGKGEIIYLIRQCSVCLQSLQSGYKDYIFSKSININWDYLECLNAIPSG